MTSVLSRTGRLRRLLICLPLAALLAACAGPSIRDLALPGNATVVLAAGDIADCRRVDPSESGAQKTARVVERELARDPATLVLTLGDHTYPVGKPAEFNDCYEPSWGRFKARTMPAPGNHEYYTPGAPGYYGYFGAQAGPAGRGYHARSLGPWRLIAINSALRGEAFAEQLAWLADELARNPAGCTLAFFHHPPFSSGGHANNNFMLPVWRLLANNGVDLVLAAHDHHYERLAPLDAEGRPSHHGAREFIVGTGGSTLSPLRLPLPVTQARDNTTLGVLKLSLRDGGYGWQFLPAVPTEFSDEGHGLCH
ncbi:MAG: Calcineurin-like phosphoesterase [Paucimonas sp.]|nr:Calcineurin-like phosphoesterase [Paucimonas sp.]